MTSPHADESAEARARLGKAFRDLGHSIAGHNIDTVDLEAAAAQLEALRQRLDAGERRLRDLERPSGDWGPGPADGEEMPSFDERPISGRAAPYALDVTIVRDGSEAVGHVTFGPAHEGAPGRCHGGIVSALFDDVFGSVLSIEAQAAFTGTLTIRYEQGTPIGVPLQCRVRLDRSEGRKLFMSGELTTHVEGEESEVVVSATAIFITIPEGAFGGGARP